MSFVEQLLPIERNFFLWLNQHHTMFWDNFMYMYSEKLTWLPLLIFCAVLFIYKVPKREAFLLILMLVIIGALCDQISSTLIKPYFERMRPSHHPDFKDYVEIVRGYRGGRLGFVSSHAANGLGIALFSSLVFRYRTYTFVSMLWVGVTAYSRIYLGVHFITDIIGGAIVAVVVGLLVYVCYQAIRKKFFKIPDKELKKSPLSKIRIQLVVSAMLLTGCVVAIYSWVQAF